MITIKRGDVTVECEWNVRFDRDCMPHRLYEFRWYGPGRKWFRVEIHWERGGDREAEEHMRAELRQYVHDREP